MFEQTIIIGNLGRDPEPKYLPSGTAVTKFSVATNRTWNNAQGEKQTETKWFVVTAFGKLAETCATYLHKGSKVMVQGRLQGDENGNPRIWTGNDQKPHCSFELTADTVKFLSSNDGTSQGEQADQSGASAEIPF